MLNAHTRKLAFIPRIRRCQKRRKLLPRYCSSATIRCCLTNGPRRTVRRLRQTANCSPVRNERQVMSKRTKYTPTERADEYLERVAALTGAKQVHGDSYWLRAGRKDFLVDSRFV